MSETIIESLIIKLGLDAKGLNTDAVDAKLNALRETVKGLDQDLKGVEGTLKGLGKSFGGFGKATKPSASAIAPLSPKEEQARKEEKIHRQRTWFNDKERLKLEKYAATDRAKRKRTPISLSGLTSMGLLGPWAAGVYLAKSVFGAIFDVFEKIKEYTGVGQQTKQMAQQVGLPGQTMEHFRAASAMFGDTTGKLSEELTSFAQSAVSTIPSRLNAGLKLLEVAPWKSSGEMRDAIDILADTADALAKLGHNSRVTYLWANEWLGMSKQMVDILQQGSGALKERITGEQDYADVLKQVDIDVKFAKIKIQVASSVKSGIVALLGDSPNFLARGIIGEWERDVMAPKMRARFTMPIDQFHNRAMGVTGAHFDNLHINLSVDKNGQVTTGVKGATIGRSQSVLLPNAPVQ